TNRKTRLPALRAHHPRNDKLSRRVCALHSKGRGVLHCPLTMRHIHLRESRVCVRALNGRELQRSGFPLEAGAVRTGRLHRAELTFRSRVRVKRYLAVASKETRRIGEHGHTTKRRRQPTPAVARRKTEHFWRCCRVSAHRQLDQPTIRFWGR